MRDEVYVTELDVSVVLPCLNESATIRACVEKALRSFEVGKLRGEVILSDNGSTDGSQEIAAQAGARVVHAAKRGYGSAYINGIAHAHAPIIVMGDSDDTYDFGEVPRLVAKIREGYDMVLASRLRGKILPGAMPWLHRYVGTPILTGILNLLFGLGVSDAHTGMRAFTREAYDKLNLRTLGMEYASEMIVTAAQARLRIAEVPITYYPRLGESKLNTWRDGWRHLRYLLLRSPTTLFILPGLVFVILGWIPLIALANGPITLGKFFIDFHYMIVGSALAMLGLQILLLGLQGKSYLVANGLDRRDALIDWIRAHVSMERGLLVGLILLASGLGLGLYIVFIWAQHSFANINELRLGLLGLTLGVSGTQIIFSSLFLSLLDIEAKDL
jgi:glycosyltransferase involved in cell wall biosynthesis